MRKAALAGEVRRSLARSARGDKGRYHRTAVMQRKRPTTGERRLDLIELVHYAEAVGFDPRGLCGVIAAKRLGAEQIIILGRHEDRAALAREFGATDVVSERGEEAVERVRELTGGLGAHSVSSAWARALRR